MDIAATWKAVFDKWPGSLARSGVLVTGFEEQIPFDGFMVSDTMLLLDRRNPDTAGARKVIMPLAQIAALKITDVVKAAPFEEMGFAGKLKQH
jgi:hypothetical protein